MPTQRQERVNNLLQIEISDIIRREMEDPHLAFLTVTSVSVSADLNYADVFVSVLGTEEQVRDTMRALRRAARFVRSHLARRLDLRQVPAVRFKLDDTAAYAQHMEELLRESGSAGAEGNELPGETE
jgi:ribosome-binding factor A